MTKFKKITALAAAAAMSASLCSCSIAGPDTTYGAVIDGYKVPAGVFIAMQMNAYYDAVYYVDPDETAAETSETTTSALTSNSSSETTVTTTTPFTDKMIEEKTVRDWINDEATKEMQKFVAVENKFDELGLSFEDNEKEKAKVYLDSIWEYYGENYEDAGISEASQLKIMINSTKKNMIFDHYYGVGGENEVSESEVRAYLDENNKRINYIEMELRDGEGNLLKSDGKEEIKKMADGYIDRLKNGEDFEKVSREYSDYYDKLKADAAAAKTDSAATNDTAPAETASSYTDNETVISKDGASPSQAVVTKAFEAKTGDVFLVEEDEVYYIVSVLDLYKDEDFYTENESYVRHTLKDDEFDAKLSEWTASQTVERNEAAYKRYKIEKFMNE